VVTRDYLTAVSMTRLILYSRRRGRTLPWLGVDLLSL